MQRVGGWRRERFRTWVCPVNALPLYSGMRHILVDARELSFGSNAANDLTWRTTPREEGLALGNSGGTAFHASDFLRV